jgi:hypothetical protein
MPGDLAPRLRVVVDAPEVIAVGHRRERPIERENLEAVPWQIQLTDDLGPQQRHHVRADGVLEARIDLFGHRRAAQHVAALEDEDLPPRSRQVRGVDEPVVSAADDDDVVVHQLLLVARGSLLVGRWLAARCSITAVRSQGL